MRNKIDVSTDIKKKLIKEFDTTRQSVIMSLSYVFNSKQANAIRVRAKELLIEEAEKIDRLQNEYNQVS